MTSAVPFYMDHKPFSLSQSIICDKGKQKLNCLKIFKVKFEPQHLQLYEQVIKKLARQGSCTWIIYYYYYLFIYLLQFWQEKLKRENMREGY